MTVGKGRKPALNDDIWQSLGLSQLVPAPLAAWRPLLIDGLAFFLEGLPAGRRASIMADQLALPIASEPGRRLAVLFAHCPTLHKLGQVLARQRSLSIDLRRPLQALESMPASTALPELLAGIRAEIGEPSLSFGEQAIAEGSVAVIVPFTYRARGELRHGVFKVLKPGVEAKLADELAILGELEGFLEERGRELGLPALDYRETLGTVRRLLLKEVHFANEQHNLRAAAAFYAGEPRVMVPRLLPWCTARLTAMERVFGGKVTDAPLAPVDRRRLADTLVSTVLAQPFWSTAQRAMFHADLHAGNLLLTTDGRLAIIDWSLTAGLTKTQRAALIAIALGGLTLDAPAIRTAIAGLGQLAVNDARLTAAVDRALDRLVFATERPGFDWLLALLDDVALRSAAGFPEDFTLFRKSWGSLSGLLGDLASRASPDVELFTAGLPHFLVELPARLASADPWRLGAAASLVPLRYWTRYWSRPAIYPDLPAQTNGSGSG